MIRQKHEQFLSCAHMLSDSENDDIVVVFLNQMKKWARAWQPRYMIIDDFAAEQRAVRLAFRELEVDEQEIFHFLCKKHFERTLNRKLADDKCKKIREHLYFALYFRKIREDCENSIKRAIDAVSNQEKRDYVEREWWKTRKIWANFARQHSCLLLQCMTTNAMKSWHVSLKKHAKDNHFFNYLSDEN